MYKLIPLSQTEGENFLVQQIWLYFYGMLVAFGVHIVTADHEQTWQDLAQFEEVKMSVKMWLVLALFFGSLGGVIVATILKMLDNIVKEYSSATANLLTAVVCSLLFPEKFVFTIFIFISMFILFLGIYLYERKPVIVSFQEPQVVRIVLKK